MTQNTNKNYDLEGRTFKFAKAIIRLCKELPVNTVNIEFIKQLVKSGTSVGANYREANEAVSKKDFIHKIRIIRRETKETTYCLELMQEANSNFEKDINSLLQESKELRNIFSSIIDKSPQ